MTSDPMGHSGREAAFPFALMLGVTFNASCFGQPDHGQGVGWRLLRDPLKHLCLAFPKRLGGFTFQNAWPLQYRAHEREDAAKAKGLVHIIIQELFNGMARRRSDPMMQVGDGRCAADHLSVLAEQNLRA